MGRKPRASVRNPRVALGYVRVSTDSERQDLGAAAQRRDITAWAAREGVEIVAWYTDEVTGGLAACERPGFDAALTALRSGDAGAFVFQKWDRFGRASQLDTAVAEAEVEKTGARLVSADSIGNDGNTLVKEISQAIARHEKKEIRGRIVRALAEKKARGEMTGKAPYGQRVGADGKTLEPDPSEQATIAKARELRAAGLSFVAVAEELEVLGVLNRKGRPFDAPAVCRMVKP